MLIKRIIAVSIFTFVISALSVTCQAEEFNPAQPLGIYEHLDSTLSDDLVFTDELGNKTNLKEAIDRPTILVLVYYECPGLCSPLLNGLAEAVEKCDLDVGKDYQIFTVSFNPVEKTPLARKKKRTYAKLVKHGDTDGHWKFFTGDSTMIKRLLDEVGFQVKKEGKEYIHPASIIVLSPEAKITRYLYGSTYFLPFDLKMAVTEAAAGRSGPTINKVLNFCFSYDPKGKKYVFNVTKISGSFILLLALLLLFNMVRKNKKKAVHPKINQE